MVILPIQMRNNNVEAWNTMAAWIKGRDKVSCLTAVLLGLGGAEHDISFA
jgi:hypothetical protein